MHNKIHFIITGGTIDSYYDPVKETAVPSERSYIPKFIPMMNLDETCVFTELFMKDSRDLKPVDRKKILEAITKSKAKRIIITHGSITIAKTAKYVQRNIGSNNKKIVFVCSLIPLMGFAPSDAGFNLGYAVAKLEDLDPGIYVCMSGRVLDPDEAHKFLSEGRFGSIYTK